VKSENCQLIKELLYTTKETLFVFAGFGNEIRYGHGNAVAADLSAVMILCFIHDAAGKVDDAVKAFELAAQNGEETAANKQLSNVFVKKAVACQKAKDMKGALENAQKSTQYVDNANAQKIIGISALSLKQNKVAAEAFEAYLSMKPDAVQKEPGILYQLGTALMATGDNQKACGYFKQISQDAKWGESARYQITQLKCN